MIGYVVRIDIGNLFHIYYNINNIVYQLFEGLQVKTEACHKNGGKQLAKAACIMKNKPRKIRMPEAFAIFRSGQTAPTFSLSQRPKYSN